jgi:hypothetical protein
LSCGFIQKIACAALAAAISGSAFPAAGEGPGVYVLSETAHSAVNERLLEMQTGFLSDSLCAGRGTGTVGAVEAAMWVERSFRRCGILPFGKSYAKGFDAGDGLAGRNIMGMLPAAGDSRGRGYVLVMAHYDGLGVLDGKMYPGADDNASGVAAMVDVALMFKKMTGYGRSYRKDIIFVATDAKNLSMKGVRELWRMIGAGELHDPLTGAQIRPEDISLAVNIDQAGSSLSPLSSGRKDYLIMLSSEGSSLRGTLRLADLKYGTDMDLGYDYYGSAAFTRMFFSQVGEQKVFLENKVPAVMFTSGITMNNNKTWDTSGTLDLPVLKKRVWLIFHWLERAM